MLQPSNHLIECAEKRQFITASVTTCSLSCPPPCANSLLPSSSIAALPSLLSSHSYLPPSHLLTFSPLLFMISPFLSTFSPLHSMFYPWFHLLCYDWALSLSLTSSLPLQTTFPLSFSLSLSLSLSLWFPSLSRFSASILSLQIFDSLSHSPNTLSPVSLSCIRILVFVPICTSGCTEE